MSIPHTVSGMRIHFGKVKVVDMLDQLSRAFGSWMEGPPGSVSVTALYSAMIRPLPACL
jgi:hypothetical protein